MKGWVRGIENRFNDMVEVATIIAVFITTILTAIVLHPIAWILGLAWWLLS